MIALNSAIDTLDNKISGKLQLELYQAVRTCCSTAWSGSCAMSTSARARQHRHALSRGHVSGQAALDAALPEAAAAARRAQRGRAQAARRP